MVENWKLLYDVNGILSLKHGRDSDSCIPVFNRS